MNNLNENKTEIKYIPMYRSYIDAVSKLTPEDRLVIYEAIFEYGFTGVEPTFDNPYLEMGWNLVKPNLVNNISNMEKQAKNGAKGGRPKKKTTTVSKTPTKVSEVVIPEVKEDVLEDVKVTPSEPIEDNTKVNLLAKVRESISSNKITDVQGESLMVEIDYEYIKTPTTLEREIETYVKDNNNNNLK